MKIFIGQIYIKAEVNFPFSLRFQRWLGNALSERVEISEQFNKSFGEEFGLGLRISAKKDISQPEIKGPTVFKRDKNVEFTIFLPHLIDDYHNIRVASLLLEQILQSVIAILEKVGLNSVKVYNDINHIRAEFLRSPDFLDTPSNDATIGDGKSHPV